MNTTNSKKTSLNTKLRKAAMALITFACFGTMNETKAMEEKTIKPQSKYYLDSTISCSTIETNICFTLLIINIVS